MSTTTTRPPEQPARADELLARPGAAVGLGALAVALAVVAVSRPGPVALVVVGGVAALVVVRSTQRFEVLVLVLLAARPLLDLTTRGGGAVGEATTLVSGGLLVGGGLWLWLNRERGRTGGTHPVLLAASCLLGASVLASLASPMPVVSLVDTAQLASGVVMLLLVDRLVVTGTPARRVMLAMGVAAATAVTFPLAGPLLGMSVTHVKDGTVALRSSYFLSNNLAHFLVLVLLVGGGVALRSGGRARLGAAAVLAVAFLELGLTATRGGWFAALVGLLVLGVLLERRLVLAVAVVVTLAVLLVPSVNARVVDLLPDDAPRTESSLAWRFGQWSDVLPGVVDDPVLGTGPGMTREQAGKEPHSEWVRFLVETGAVGFAAWLWLAVAMVGTSLRLRRLCPTGVEAGFAAGVAAVVVSFLAASLGENLVLTTSYSWYLMALLGIATAWTRPGPATGPPTLARAVGAGTGATS